MESVIGRTFFPPSFGVYFRGIRVRIDHFFDVQEKLNSSTIMATAG
jgi:hypothetical protein